MVFPALFEAFRTHLQKVPVDRQTAAVNKHAGVDAGTEIYSAQFLNGHKTETNEEGGVKKKKKVVEI